MSNRKKLMIWLAATIIVQLGIYFYLDRILFAPDASFQVSAVAESIANDGKTFYSRDQSYMARVEPDAVKIYAMPRKQLVRTINLGTQQVSYFTWLEDRNIALLGLHSGDGQNSKVTLTQINPLRDDPGLSATIEKLPTGSRITDVAYSTATNVVYIQIQTVADPVPLYRVYRTDANHDIRRIYFNTNRIGRIGVLQNKDSLVFENLKDDTIIVRHGDGSWKVISPPQGKYRLVGVDSKNNIYIARLNQEGLGETIMEGRLGVGFTFYRKLNKPTAVRDLKLADIILKEST
ncbi:Hypothetical protein LUCI_4289 [Lucifera butyrica]|uniref:Uncharacterized protein n=1 Tax=Lucifera butyrica TaxID=1351585 RepID=A0A498RFY5_9FIRM|nr:hypothetical protein [Lucifera butyrica]VBB09003.1 Hypothetical protein LUCI_4289 [Lucifera butyrica]